MVTYIFICINSIIRLSKLHFDWSRTVNSGQGSPTRSGSQVRRDDTNKMTMMTTVHASVPTSVRSTGTANAPGRRRIGARRGGSVRMRSTGGGDSSNDDDDVLASGERHAEYVRDAAGKRAPAELPALLRVLVAQGYALRAPSARSGTHPLVVPLGVKADADDGETVVVGLMMREDEGEDSTPVVAVRDGVHLTLLAKNASQYVHRAIVEEEATSDERETKVAAAAGSVGVSLHNHGAYKTSGKEFDVYVTTQVGKFPSSMEGLVRRHLNRGDEQSALITCDLYKSTFGEWGAPHVFICDLYAKLGRGEEARDAARHALQTPWATIGSADAVTRMIELAGWKGKTVGEIKEVLESRRGPSAAAFDGPKTPEQLAREESELLLDQIVAGEVDVAKVNQRLAECYMNAGKGKLAKFIMCGMTSGMSM